MKYYTPEISEFHVGFEYERCDDGYKWFSDVYPRALEHIKLENFLSYTRVKYLDREDIESLDYVLHRKDVTMGYDEYCHKRHKEVLPPGNDSNLNVILKKGNNVIVYKNLEIVFSGTIKNKSELKKLLKQLGI